MTSGFHVRSHGLWNAAEALRYHGDLAATAGTRLTGLGELMAGPRAGISLAAAMAAFSLQWTGALDDLVLSMTELSELTGRAASIYLTTDEDVAYQLGAVHS